MRNNRTAEELFEKLCMTFGNDKGEEIINVIVSHCGGQRMSVPDFDDLYRIGRNRVIKRQLNKGATITALMIEHKLSRRQVLRICTDGDGE